MSVNLVLLVGQERMEGLEDRGATGASEPFSPSPPSRGRGRGPGKGRSNRGRTVLTEKQRTILTACFQHNPKPDALLKVVTFFKLILQSRIFKLFKICRFSNYIQQVFWDSEESGWPDFVLGTAGRNDGVECSSNSSLVSKPTLQRTQAGEGWSTHIKKGQCDLFQGSIFCFILSRVGEAPLYNP